MSEVVETVGTASRQRSTFGAWEGLRPATLNSGDQYIADAYDDSAFDESFELVGSTGQDATTYSHMRAAAGEEGSFTRADPGVRFEISTIANYIIRSQEAFTRTEGLGATYTGTQGTGIRAAFRLDTGDDQAILRCFFYDWDPTSQDGGGRAILSNGVACLLAGLVILDGDRGIHYVDTVGKTSEIYHITVDGCDEKGLNVEAGGVSGLATARNIIATRCGTDFFPFESGSGTVDGDYIITSDLTADDAGATNFINSVTVASLYYDSTAGQQDVHLRRSDSPTNSTSGNTWNGLTNPALAFAEDLGAGLWDNDITGESRTAKADQDCGAHQRSGVTYSDNTSTVGATARNHSTWGAAAAQLPANLVHAKTHEIFEMYDDADFDEEMDATTWGGSDEDAYLTTIVPVAERHVGVFGAGVVNDVTSDMADGADVSFASAPYTEWIGMQWTYSGTQNTGSGTSSYCKLNAVGCKAIRCITWANNAGISGENRGFSSIRACGVEIYRCISAGLDIASGGTSCSGIRVELQATDTGADCLVYGCTMDNITGVGLEYRGIDTGTTVRGKNNIATLCSLGSFTYPTIDGTLDHQFNMSDDGTADDQGSNNVANVTRADQYVSVTGAGDYHLKLGADAIGVGTDLGAPYNVDINGLGVAGAASIGAHQFPAVAASAVRSTALVQASSATAWDTPTTARLTARVYATSTVVVDTPATLRSTQRADAGKADARITVLTDTPATVRATQRASGASTTTIDTPATVLAQVKIRGEVALLIGTPAVVRAQVRVQGNSQPLGGEALSPATVRATVGVRAKSEVVVATASVLRATSRAFGEVDLLVPTGPVRFLARVRAQSTVAVDGQGATVRIAPARVTAPPLVAARAIGHVRATMQVQANSTTATSTTGASSTVRTVGLVRATSTVIVDTPATARATGQVRGPSTTAIATTAQGLALARIYVNSTTAGLLDAQTVARSSGLIRATSTTLIDTPGHVRGLVRVTAIPGISGAEPRVDAAIAHALVSVRAASSTVVATPATCRLLIKFAHQVDATSGISIGGPAVAANLPRLFLGALTGNRLFQADVGHEDAGQPIAIRVETDPSAPAGAGGEAIFPALYFVCTLHDADVLPPFATFDLAVTPILDGVDLETQTVTLTMTNTRTIVHQELGLSVPLMHAGVERGRFAPRGTWFAVRFDVATVVRGLLVLDGVAVEREIVRESVLVAAGTP